MTSKICGIPTTISLNEYRNTFWRKLNELKQDFEWLVVEALGRNREQIKTPCRAVFTFYYQTKRNCRDLDGQIASVKFTLDTLVNLEMLPNDTPEYITEIVLKDGGKKSNTFDVEFIP